MYLALDKDLTQTIINEDKDLDVMTLAQSYLIERAVSPHQMIFGGWTRPDCVSSTLALTHLLSMIGILCSISKQIRRTNVSIWCRLTKSYRPVHVHDFVIERKAKSVHVIVYNQANKIRKNLSSGTTLN